MNSVMIAAMLAGFLAVLFSAVLLVRKDVLNLGLIVKQVTSGRWLLTVTAGLCMLIAMATDAWIAIKSISANPAVTLPFPVSTIFSIMTGVFTFYFLKDQAVNAVTNAAQSAAIDADQEKLLAKKLETKLSVESSKIEPPKLDLPK